ncbi:phospholipase D family protein [Vibrio parahaemolyticus]|uniref:phospholipase D family protein n=1 Tax=Vibrio parahaemolyticus TaxID=670 RepID=UPI001112D73D|nr:phospholipase D family protein [Vibrio parahaemolyticus]
MSFTFQTPFEGSGSLIDAVGDGSKGAISGGGVYAFASAKGIDLLFTQTEFSNFLESSGGNYHLIVGIDEITNSNSLIKLAEFQESYENLKVNVFYHKENKLFHPKFTWFLKNSGEGELIIGSGNLTESGVSNNWEAFFSIEQCKDEFNETLKAWDDFLEEHSSFLLSIDDERILNAAKENDSKPYLGRGKRGDIYTERDVSKPKPSSGASLKRTPSVLEKADDVDIEPSIFSAAEQVEEIRFLAREAMTARERGDYSQILFSEEAYTEFFKFKSGDYIYYDIYNKDGYLGQVVNPSITVKASSNYAIGISSRKEGKSKGKAEPEIKSNFMLDIRDINNTPPILLIVKVSNTYKVVFSHPSNGLKSLHLKLSSFLKGSKEKILTEDECNDIVADIPLVSAMIS